MIITVILPGDTGDTLLNDDDDDNEDNDEDSEEEELAQGLGQNYSQDTPLPTRQWAGDCATTR